MRVLLTLGVACWLSTAASAQHGGQPRQWLPYGQWVYGFKQPPPNPVRLPSGAAPKARSDGTVRGGRGSGLDLNPKQLIELLADPQMSESGKLGIEEELLDAGMDIVPALAWLASEPPRKVHTAERDLRSASAHLLYRLLIPSLQPGRRAPAHLVGVEDWREWLDKRRGQSLETLQREMAAKLKLARKSGQKQFLD